MNFFRFCKIKSSGDAKSNNQMKATYLDLFKERKWKEALDAMPLGAARIVPVSSARDLQILRVRASDFNKETDKVASISVDYDWMPEKEHIIVTVTKKQESL